MIRFVSGKYTCAGRQIDSKGMYMRVSKARDKKAKAKAAISLINLVPFIFPASKNQNERCADILESSSYQTPSSLFPPVGSSGPSRCDGPGLEREAVLAPVEVAAAWAAAATGICPV